MLSIITSLWHKDCVLFCHAGMGQRVHTCWTTAKSEHVCLLVCACMHVRTSMWEYVHVCECSWVCTCVCEHVHGYVHMCVCMCVCEREWLCVHVCLYVSLCICVCVCVYVYMYVHIYGGQWQLQVSCFRHHPLFPPPTLFLSVCSSLTGLELD